MKTADTITLPKKINPNWRVGIVHSSFYLKEVGALVKGAKEVLLKAGIKEKNITIHPVAGSFEVPLIGANLAKNKKVDALIGLGIIVEGETAHASLLAEQSARGIMDVQIKYNIPFAFEILYVKSLIQAQKRSSKKHNKGAEAARAAIHTLAHFSPEAS